MIDPSPMAADAVVEHVRGDVIVPLGNGEPVTLLDAIEAHAAELSDVRIHQMHALHELVAAANDRDQHPHPRQHPGDAHHDPGHPPHRGLTLDESQGDQRAGAEQDDRPDPGVEDSNVASKLLIKVHRCLAIPAGNVMYT